ncbi:MAG: glycosyltransferase [Thermosynechococcaceae cyanobacterium MS004]|nr:glycosyltransferase [Thermosynechococcaceae cyanobacterium MS004]
MKVLHVIPSISPVRGGPSQAVLEMVQALRQRGIEADIATTNDNGLTELDLPLHQRFEHPVTGGGTVPVYCFPRQRSKISAVREFIISGDLRRWLKQQAKTYDLLHVHAIFSYAPTAAMAIARHQGIPYFSRPLGQLCEWSLTQSRLRKQIYLNVIERANLKGSQGLHFTAIQEQQEAAALNLNVGGFVLPHGLRMPAPIPQARLKLREQLQLPPDEPILLFMSRLHPKKGLDALIAALARLKTERFTFLLAGSGDPDYEATLNDLLRDNGLEARTRKVGFATGETKQLYLQGADLFALTSHSENFGIAVLEALAAGTPALLTPGVALAELVQQQNLGWVCDLEIQAIAEAAQTALQDAQARRDKGDRARQIVEAQYSWDSIALQLEAQYRTVLQSSTANSSTSNIVAPSPLYQAP